MPDLLPDAQIITSFLAKRKGKKSNKQKNLTGTLECSAHGCFCSSDNPTGIFSPQRGRRRQWGLEKDVVCKAKETSCHWMALSSIPGASCGCLCRCLGVTGAGRMQPPIYTATCMGAANTCCALTCACLALYFCKGTSRSKCDNYQSAASCHDARECIHRCTHNHNTSGTLANVRLPTWMQLRHINAVWPMTHTHTCDTVSATWKQELERVLKSRLEHRGRPVEVSGARNAWSHIEQTHTHLHAYTHTHTHIHSNIIQWHALHLQRGKNCLSLGHGRDTQFPFKIAATIHSAINSMYIFQPHHLAT